MELTYLVLLIILKWFYPTLEYDILMNVTLDIFSGRPNPTWPLSQEQILDFIKKISNLKTTEKFHNNYDDKNGLGYRGFIVEEKKNLVGETKVFDIKNGTINVIDINSSYILEDKEYKIESWLLDTAPKYVDNDILKMVKKEIENRRKEGT